MRSAISSWCTELSAHAAPSAPERQEEHAARLVRGLAAPSPGPSSCRSMLCMMWRPSWPCTNISRLQVCDACMQACVRACRPTRAQHMHLLQQCSAGNIDGKPAGQAQWRQSAAPGGMAGVAEVCAVRAQAGWTTLTQRCALAAQPTPACTSQGATAGAIPTRTTRCCRYTSWPACRQAATTTAQARGGVLAAPGCCSCSVSTRAKSTATSAAA